MTSRSPSPTPDSLSASSSPASSSTDLQKMASASAYSPASSAPSSACPSPVRARSRSPVYAKDLLAPPETPSWRERFSRSPSPLGLIPIHREFSRLVRCAQRTIHKHEVPRKLLHVSIGFVVLSLYKLDYEPTSIVPPLAAALVPVASADVARFYSPSFNAFYIRMLGALMRESEVRGWNGVVWYLVGTITVLSTFPKDVAVLSILLLSWCDTAASTVGRAWGRYTWRIRSGKSLAGCAASFLVGAATAAAWYGSICNDAQMWRGRLGAAEGGLALAAMSLVTGLIASASEAVDAWGLDDNVVIPVLSAVGIWGVLKVFG